MGSAFSAVADECVGVLEAVAVDWGTKVAPRASDGSTGNRFNASDFIFPNHDGIDDFDFEEMGIYAVLAFRKNLELRAFFTAVAKKGFAVLEEVAVDGSGHEESRRDGVAGDGANDADLIVRDFEEGAFAGAIDEWDEEVDAGSENSSLNPDFVSERDGATVRHVGTEPAPFEEDNLITSGDGDGAVNEVEAYDDEGGERGMADDEVEYGFHAVWERVGRVWI